MSHTDRQTDRQSYPDYLSIRVTCPKCDHLRVLEKVFGEIDYVAYPHKGKKTKKEHFHLFTPNVSEKNKLRERLRSAGFEGNGQVCIKVYHNGIQYGIQYGSKEDTEPYVRGDFADIIASAPKWQDTTVQSDIRRYREAPSRKERFWMLTRANIVRQAAIYKADNNVHTNRLTDILKLMFKHTNWRLDLGLRRQLLSRGENVGYFLQNEFMVFLGLEEPSIEWSDEFVVTHSFN